MDWAFIATDSANTHKQGNNKTTRAKVVLMNLCFPS